jgi:PBP1b-binding outer membrane lipoprotein LpoB
MKKTLALAAILITAVCLTGCQTVDVTKTAKGFHAPTNPNDVEILMTKPDRSYEELGTITAVKFKPSDTAKMHNAIRAKAAPLGANAVILTGVGITQNNRQYGIGVAIAWK